MTFILRLLFFTLVVRPLVFIFLGPYARGRNHLPRKGPAIIIANHNSHLDTAVIMSLFPLGDMLRLVRPVAAADYWLKNRALAYFALNIVGVVPILRRRAADADGLDPLTPVSEALNANQIVVYYPEGTRGEPERLGHFKAGIARLAERHPRVPIIPIFLQGTGQALPRGEGLMIPFVCDAYIGEPLFWDGDSANFHRHLEARFEEQIKAAHVRVWS